MVRSMGSHPGSTMPYLFLGESLNLSVCASVLRLQNGHKDSPYLIGCCKDELTGVTVYNNAPYVGGCYTSVNSYYLLMNTWQP